MKFLNPLSKETQAHVAQCDISLTDSRRLEVLKSTSLMDTPKDETFDRLAELAAKIFNAPLTIVSLIDDKKQFFKASFGMPSPFDVTREIPIGFSVCRYTLKGEPIIVNDSSKDPLLKEHPSTEPWGIGSIMVMPLLKDGVSIGAFSVVKPKAHVWTEAEIHTMKVLTSSVIEEINHKEVIASLEIEREMRERFVSSLTHDLRTPLTAAKINAQLMLKNSELTPALVKKAQQVISSIDRATNMVSDLLDANRIKADQQITLSYDEVNLTAITQTALKELSLIFGDRFIFEEDSLFIGHWHYGSIQRIIENLCSNAVKYGSKSEPIQIKISSAQEGVTLSVHNFGNPIPESEQSSLFEQYTRSQSALDSEEVGWGLGLALVKGLTDAHKGNISVHSNKTEGTTFSVTLPWDSRSGIL